MQSTTLGRHRKPVKHFPPRCVRVSRGDGRGCWTEGRHTLSVDRPLQSARSPAKPKEPFLSSLLLPHHNVRGHSSFLAPSRASDERACISIATPRFRLSPISYLVVRLLCWNSQYPWGHFTDHRATLCVLHNHDSESDSSTAPSTTYPPTSTELV